MLILYLKYIEKINGLRSPLMEKINGKSQFSWYIIVLTATFTTFAEKCRMSIARMSFRVVNIPSVHVKHDVGGISVDDKVARN